MISIQRKIRPNLGAADWLSLAATPTFATMAIASRILDANHSAMLCSMPHNASSMSGMVPMYMLMSVFHSAAWLKLIGKQFDRVRRPDSNGNVRHQASSGL